MTTPTPAEPKYSDAEIDRVAKLIADKFGNGMREKYEDVARTIVESLLAYRPSTPDKAGVSDADVEEADRKNAIDASVEYLKGALDEVYKISGSALLAGEKCKKSDTAICYQLACSVIGSLISAISDLEAIYPSAAMKEQSHD